MKINFSEVQRNIAEIANREEYTIDVLYELMAAYGRAAASITKLRNGIYNLADDQDNIVLQRGVVYFKVVEDFESLPAEVEKLEQDPLTQRYNPRFLIATDLETFAAKDTKKGNTLEIAWADIDRNVDFFYGWTGDEVTDEKTEAAADRRAADKMKDLYQELEKVNLDKFKDKDSNFRHHLNVFFTRLLFCFFAEDTRVFAKNDDNIFTDAIKDFTQVDGSDLNEFLSTLFESLDEEDKSKYTSPFSKFPYVNGKLFDKNFAIEIPKFNAQARKIILDCGALGWSKINPDIFGSMFQSIVDEDHRSTYGMHYTSVPNIMKTIEPLFLDELRDDFDKNYDNPKKLQQLHDRISNIKIFDPACGSGNFLIIAYKELRKLEHAIIERIFADEFHARQLKNKLQSRINLDNFYGIEIDDFACEVAVLSLYIAKHQMNIEFEKQFGKEIKLIPLKDKANIVHGNAARLDWQEVCPNISIKQSMITEQQAQLIVTDNPTNHLLVEEKWDEIYLISNPPYLGSRIQKKPQKDDLSHLFKGSKYPKGLDYISIWFIKGSHYIKNTKAQLAFVSTNSVAQGEHVGMLWPMVLIDEINIKFAYTSFPWSNSAINNAGVTCVIIGLQSGIPEAPKLFKDGRAIRVTKINPYLVEGHHVYLYRRSKSLSGLSEMVFGNMAADGGHLILSEDERISVLSKNPGLKKYIPELLGASELIKGTKRYCLWLGGAGSEIISNKFIKQRVLLTKKVRLSSSRPKLAQTPHIFAQISADPNSFSTAIVIPRVSSERREYIPIGFIKNDIVPTDRLQVIPNGRLFDFAVLTSKIHMDWINRTCGRLKSDYNYSVDIVYNNFPLKKLSDHERNNLNKSAREILFTRQNHTEKTLAEMYDPDKMPDDLREAHHQNDLLVDSLYRKKPYNNDEERLADLFKLYEEMTANEEKR